MIQINSTLTTVDGGVIATGATIDITANFKSQVANLTNMSGITTGTSVIHSVHYKMEIYRNMEAYEAGTTSLDSRVLEFPTTYIEENIDLAALDAATGSMDTVTSWLQTFVENGLEGPSVGGGYPGVGAGNTEIVYPTFL